LGPQQEGLQQLAVGTGSTSNASVLHPETRVAELTLHNYILAGLLVPLTLATDLVSHPIALVV